MVLSSEDSLFQMGKLCKLCLWKNTVLQNVMCIQLYDWSWQWEDLGVTVKCFVDILNLIFKLQCLKLFQAITFTHKLLNCEQQYIQVVKFHIRLLFWQGE